MIFRCTACFYYQIEPPKIFSSSSSLIECEDFQTWKVQIQSEEFGVPSVGLDLHIHHSVQLQTTLEFYLAYGAKWNLGNLTQISLSTYLILWLSIFTGLDIITRAQASHWYKYFSILLRVSSSFARSVNIC